ncbi:SDR family NAD(P)-dependent oxidoreductase [Conexibacter sp. DBS9H8]|uniref:SDR family NAD(P)-dependent oxidoreductase n=1 Tax=Conexibacter sp. DBS9H8 TaxID=2937801 RepID=UPI00200F5617|nr:SDR family NAD(P)-dependent oxidoreductase [Conexibacter sp. DBS9H8]
MSGVKAAGARIVVTGAGSGIGEATALRFSRSGAQVICIDIDGERVRATAAACAGEAVAFTCDVAESDALQAAAEAIERDHGPIDVVVNNAGVGMGGPFLDATAEDWEWLMRVNLDGVANGCRSFGAPMVQRRHGHVVNVASAAAYVMNRDMAAYCASKAAVLALSRCLRADWAGSGVGVSVICPGVISTPIVTATRLLGPLAGRQAHLQRQFRFGHAPDAVAKAIVRATEKNQAVVPVGLEAGIAHRAAPFIPGPVQALLDRAPIGRI